MSKVTAPVAQIPYPHLNLGTINLDEEGLIKVHLMPPDERGSGCRKFKSNPEYESLHMRPSNSIRGSFFLTHVGKLSLSYHHLLLRFLFFRSQMTKKRGGFFLAFEW